jgi:tRNA A37 threonylcarbamoyladenosine modification protein TsaB
MLDARRGEVYAAGYAGASRREVVVPEGVYTPEELCARIRPPCVLVGEGAALCGSAIAAALGEGVALLPPPEGNASARHVGALGVEQLARGSWVLAAQLVPHYLRRAEAEVKRTGERFEPAPKSPNPT